MKHNSCAEFLTAATPQIQMQLKRLKKINPTWASTFHGKDVAALYLFVKQELWRLSPHGEIPFKDLKVLPTDLVDNLKLQFGKAYSLSQMSEREIYIFYVNALHGVLASLSNDLRENYVHAHFKVTVEENEFLRDLIDTFFFPQSLEARELSPERAKEFLDLPLGDKGFFELALEFRQDFKQTSGVTARTWLKTQARFLTLDALDQDRIQKVMSGFKLRNLCCDVKPGCILCPNNLRFLSKNNCSKGCE